MEESENGCKTSRETPKVENALKHVEPTTWIRPCTKQQYRNIAAANKSKIILVLESYIREF